MSRAWRFLPSSLLLSLSWAQVGAFGQWGGHTSKNDLTARAEVWTRFYAIYGAGIRFLPERRLEPQIIWNGGQFISQDRSQGRYARTQWSAIGVSLRARPLKGDVSPYAQLGFHRFSIGVRDREGRTIPGIPSQQGVNGLSWGLGLVLRIIEGVEWGVGYSRYRPQTTRLEGLAGPAKDRIEAISTELTVYFPEKNQTKSRF